MAGKVFTVWWCDSPGCFTSKIEEGMSSEVPKKWKMVIGKRIEDGRVYCSACKKKKENL